MRNVTDVPILFGGLRKLLKRLLKLLTIRRDRQKIDYINASK